MITIDFNAFFSYRHVRGLRNNNGMILETKRARTDLCRYSFFYKVQEKNNKLPIHSIVTSSSLNDLQTNLSKYLLEQSLDDHIDQSV